MIINFRIFDLLEKLAIDTDPVSNAKVAAAVVNKNNIISFGTCKYKTHPLQDKFKKNDSAIFLHAEIDAINNALNRIKTKKIKPFTDKANSLVGYDLYVCRVKREDHNGDYVWAMSKPCNGCMGAIDFFGIDHIIHTIDVDTVDIIGYN